MDVLKDKSGRDYNYLSRYASFPFYFNSEDNKFIYGLTSQLKTDIPYVIVDVDASTTLDKLSNKYYGRPDYFWIIADFNKIQDPFIQLNRKFKSIKVPALASIEFEV